MKKEKILVSGGTGFLGRAMTQKLLQKGKEVRILTRSQAKAKELFKTSVEITEGEITKPETLPKALEGISVVIQCAQFPGHPVENPKKGWTYFEIDALGTENLAKASKQAGVNHFIYISGAGTNSKAKEPWFKAKWYAEQAIHGAGLPATILRPPLIYGPGDRSLNRLITFLKKTHTCFLLGGGKNNVQPLFIQDFVEIVMGSLETAKEKDLLLDIAGPEIMSIKEMIKRTAKILNIPCFLIPVPTSLAKMATFPLKFLPNPPMTPQAIDFITMDVVVDTHPMQKVFPHIQWTSFEEGLKSYL